MVAVLKFGDLFARTFFANGSDFLIASRITTIVVFDGSRRKTMILLKTTNPAITSCFSRFIRHINFSFEL